MIEADNLADRFGRARQQTSQVCATGERARERHDGPIECIPAGAVLAADPDDGIRRCDGLDLFHHAPHGFAAAGDTVKMELAPVLGFQIHVFHDLSSFIAAHGSRVLTRRLLTPIAANIVWSTRSRIHGHCAPTAAGRQPYIVVLPVESIVKAVVYHFWGSREQPEKHWAKNQNSSLRSARPADLHGSRGDRIATPEHTIRTEDIRAYAEVGSEGKPD